MIVEVEIEAGREMLQSHENQVVMKKSVQDKRTAVKTNSRVTDGDFWPQSFCFS